MTNVQETGRWGEDVACLYIKHYGGEILERNYHSRYGEIDIIARDGDSLVFVEVKTRAVGGLVDGRDAITTSKRRKLTATAQTYLQKCNGDQPARFDVIVVTGHKGHIENIERIKDAF